MTGRLKLIEQQLLGIDSAAFQNLCDVYLTLRETEFSSFNRTGSQLGKQKTIKGTPDTFFRLSGGSLRYVEFTTKADNLVQKIIDDIDKCLDENKTGVSANDVDKIIMFFNSRLDTEEETKVIKHAKTKSILVELIGLDTLAIDIYSKYPILSKDILGIPCDTGQLIPLQNFIEEYTNKAGGLSTPLNNQFFHRVDELKEIDELLSNTDLLVISGFPGVGKTKIALEVIKEFQSKNDGYSSLAITKKDQDISEDLRISLLKDKNYILLVDDANRQLLNFKQILGLIKEKRTGNIKLVITVRDYALKDIENECFEFETRKIELKKFTDEEITQIISSDSFEIRNPTYQKRIVEISDGNARLAIMAAKLAIQKQTDFLIGDVSDLYDSYFQTFIKDFDIFSNNTLIKTLGLISFFFSIDRNNKDFIDTLLNNFEIDYYEFNEAISELENKELVEVQYHVVRVSEQVMATYFFYNVFIKNKTLSFKTLLFNYFPVWKKRFSDTIIPSTNSFGYKNILNRTNGILDNFFNSISSNREDVLSYFSLFWFFKREELLSYFFNEIKLIPEPKDPQFSTNYETNDFVWDRDNTLDNISVLFNQFTESYIPALELSFEYCRKKPNSLPELVRRIREKVSFDNEDYQSNYLKQIKLIDLLILKAKENQPHYVEAFFALSKTFLAHSFQQTKGGRNHSMVIYQHFIPVDNLILTFRKNIWTAIFDFYPLYPDKVIAIISNYQPSYHGLNIELLEYDLSFIIPFIDTNFERTKFEHIYVVQELISWLNREKKVQDRSYQKFKDEFHSKDYEFFRKLDWNRLKNKEEFDFKNHREFEHLKTVDIRKSFAFTSIDEFASLHRAIQNTLFIEPNKSWGLEQSLNIITEENFIRNEKIGFQLLETLLQNYTPKLGLFYKVIIAISNKSEEWAKKLWELLNSWENDSQNNFKLCFLSNLPLEHINEYYKDELLITIKAINKHHYIDFDSFDKYIKFDKKLISHILEIIVDKIENENIQISLSWHFFEKYSKSFVDNFGLLSKAYIQQAKFDKHSDYDKAGLRTLIELNTEFLYKYLDIFYNKELMTPDTDIDLSFIWELHNYHEIIMQSINQMIKNTVYLGIGEHSICVFFKSENQEIKTKAKKFILDYITTSNSDSIRMNAIIDVVRHKMNDFFEEAFLHYLNLNPDLDNFERIYWIGNGGEVHVNVDSIGEITAKKWQNIQSITNKSPKQLELIPIKTYLKKQIENYLRYGEAERKRKFLNPMW